MAGHNRQIRRTSRQREILGATLLAFISLVCLPFFVRAQSAESFPLAQTIRVSDLEVAYGDIVLFDKETALYRVSQAPNDPRFYGIAVEDPALLIQTDAAFVPVAQSGIMPVNVTLENGDIAQGDPLASSSVPGKAMRSEVMGDGIFGFALEPLNAENGVAGTTETGEVVMGTIMVEVGGERLQNFLLEREEEPEGLRTTLGATIFRYIAAGVVALGAIFISFYTFLSSVRQSVISVGRNPRAKGAIRSMVILNVILAIVVSAVGVFFAILIVIA